MTTNTAPNAPKPVDEKKAKRNAERKVAREFLRGQLTNEKLSEDIRKALKILVGTGERVVGAKGSPIMDKIRELFTKNKKVDELTLFKETKMGRGEMRKRVRQFVKDCEPAQRMWIAFDEKTEEWVLLGTGEKAPKDWNGVFPANSAE